MLFNQKNNKANHKKGHCYGSNETLNLNLSEAEVFENWELLLAFLDLFKEKT